VTDVVPASGVSDDELLQVSAAVERQSQHPLAQAVGRRADAAGIPVLQAAPLESVTGRGVRSEVNGQAVEIGNARLFVEGWASALGGNSRGRLDGCKRPGGAS
jgi:cation transport ATPase